MPRRNLMVHISTPGRWPCTRLGPQPCGLLSCSLSRATPGLLTMRGCMQPAQLRPADAALGRERGCVAAALRCAWAQGAGRRCGAGAAGAGTRGLQAAPGLGRCAPVSGRAWSRVHASGLWSAASRLRLGRSGRAWSRVLASGLWSAASRLRLGRSGRAWSRVHASGLWSAASRLRLGRSGRVWSRVLASGLWSAASRLRLGRSGRAWSRVLASGLWSAASRLRLGRSGRAWSRVLASGLWSAASRLRLGRSGRAWSRVLASGLWSAASRLRLGRSGAAPDHAGGRESHCVLQANVVLTGGPAKGGTQALPGRLGGAVRPELRLACSGVHGASTDPASQPCRVWHGYGMLECSACKDHMVVHACKACWDRRPMQARCLMLSA